MIPWEIQADEFVCCNCSYGCPCQFNALPTHGFCEAAGGFAIRSGRFADVSLDGLAAVGVLKWPGPIHEGKGAVEAQRKALLTILAGKETAPFATMWNVFASTIETVHPPQFRRIDISVDVEARRGRISIDGIVNMWGEPIRNPVTGAEHRARIDLVGGFEYEIAEIGSGTAEIGGPLPLSLKNTYAQFAHIHLNNNGIVPSRKTAA
jgi:hypothetical protein